MPERGFTGGHGGAECHCDEDFEHGGPCHNTIRGKDYWKCQPCSVGWHFPFPCPGYLSPGLPTLTTQCQTCGWDSANHPFKEGLVVDARLPRRNGLVVEP